MSGGRLAVDREVAIDVAEEVEPEARHRDVLGRRELLADRARRERRRRAPVRRVALDDDDATVERRVAPKEARDRAAHDPAADDGDVRRGRSHAATIASAAGARIIRDSRACSSVDRASASGAEGRRFESCRARHCNLFGQRQRQSVRIGRLRQPDTHDLGAGDRDPVVDGAREVADLASDPRPVEPPDGSQWLGIDPAVRLVADGRGAPPFPSIGDDSEVAVEGIEIEHVARWLPEGRHVVMEVDVSRRCASHDRGPEGPANA